MTTWELRCAGNETETYDSPAELGAALAWVIGGDVMLVELACVEDDGTKREPTDVERAAISAAVDRQRRDVHVQDDTPGQRNVRKQPQTPTG
jgi:hypothetical protein